LHILTCFRASYAEKGYYLWTIRLLLIGDIITTYGQKGYYLWVMHLFVPATLLIFVFLG